MAVNESSSEVTELRLDDFNFVSLELERCRRLASLLCRDLSEQDDFVTKDEFSLLEQLLDRIGKVESVFHRIGEPLAAAQIKRLASAD